MRMERERRRQNNFVCAAPSGIRFVTCLAFYLLALVVSPAAAVAQDNPTLQLLHAATRGDAASIPTLVARGANPNAGLNSETGEVGTPDEDDLDVNSALTLSTYCGCPHVTRALVQAGANPMAQDIAIAIGFNQPEVARAMLPRFNPSPDRPPFIALLPKRMPAEASAMFRSLLVRYILTGEAPGDADESMIWAQIFAIAYARDSNDPIFGLLSDLAVAGYDIEAEHDYEETNRTARDMASRRGDVLLARALSARGAALPSGWTVEREKEVQLAGAASAGHLPGVEMLLAEGVSPNSTSPNGRYALAEALEQGHFDIARRILAAGADPNLSARDQASPLVSAAKADQVAIAEVLLDKGAIPDRHDGNGQFALQAAARQGAVKMIELLLRRGATAQFRDAGGGTALHHLMKPSDDAPRAAPDRPVTPAHLETVRILVAAGLPLEAVNSQNQTVLGSNFRAGDDLTLIEALLEVGAKAQDPDLETAIAQGNARLLRTLLPYARSPRLPVSLLQMAAVHLEHAPDIPVALLEHGVHLPTVEDEQLSLLADAAAAPTEVALGLLLTQGLPLAADSNNKALEAALTKGRSKNVALLASRGLDLTRQDMLGRTALHRVIANDVGGSSPSRLGPLQQASITALIDAGFPIDTRDSDGKTVVERATRKPSTLSAVNAAIGAAGASAQGLHGAIRRNELNKVRQLAANPTQREAADTLGRTPLGLALQLRNWPAARILLRAGASIAATSRSSWQPADIDFAGEPEIASAFAVRLLTGTLIDIPDDRTQPALLAARAAYRDNRSPVVDNFVWKLNCAATATTCGSGAFLAGNKKMVMDLIESRRFERGSAAHFGLIQRNLRSIHFSSDINLGSFGGTGHFDFGEITFFIGGKGTISSCPFSFDVPRCAPGVRIHNPNTSTGLRMLTDTGYEELPTANLRFIQANGISGEIPPGKEIILDRSVGPITLEMDEVKARVFALWVETERITGESVQPLPAEPTTQNRMNLYTRILRLLQQRKAQPAPGAEQAANKTIASTVAALSAEAYLSGYPKLVLELLRQQAQVVARLDLQVRQIQNAVLAQATYTPEQIDVLIAQIDTALSSPTTNDRAVLLEIRQQLVRLRASAEATGVAVNELRNTLFTDADFFIELYQALVLEYRQYVPSSEIQGLSTDERQAILRRVSGREVVITDDTAGGTGKTLRAAFGLPDPTP
jgi:ankyrin repeat protein